MNEMDVLVILGLAEHDMNLSKAAKLLFVHRNTMVYHINRVKRITGLNPMKFYDLCKLVKMAKEMGTEDNL